MRTAKEIIEEYKARGYNMESLRVLADSRDEPLRAEMLALLSNESTPAASEASAGGEDMVFFVVGNEEESEAQDVVNFDVLSALDESLHSESMQKAQELHDAVEAEPETAAAAESNDIDDIAEEVACQAASSVFAVPEEPMAAVEESVAEIMIGDDEGVSFVQFDSDGHETNVFDYLPGMDIESRQEPSQEEAKVESENNEEITPVEDEQIAEPEEAAIESAAATEEIPVESNAEISADNVDSAIQMLLQAQNILNFDADLDKTETEQTLQEMLENIPVAETDEEVESDTVAIAENEPEQDAVVEPEAPEMTEADSPPEAIAEDEAEQDFVAEPEAEEIAGNLSADEEIGGIESDAVTTADNEAEQDFVAEPEAEEIADDISADEAVGEVEPDVAAAVESEVAVQEAAEEIVAETKEDAETEASKLEAKAAKRHRRAERRRAKKEKLKAEQLMETVLGNLPEIVLSASEGTETLSEESCRDLQLHVAALDEADQEEVESGMAESAQNDDFAMVTASGNMDMTMAERRAFEESAAAENEEELSVAFTGAAQDEVDAGEEEIGLQNVIRLFDAQDEFAELEAEYDAEMDEDSGFAGSLLLLTGTEEEDAAAEAVGEVEETDAGLSPMVKLGLVRALVGDPSIYDSIAASEESATEESGHVIVEPAIAPAPEYDAAFIAQMEEAYQANLDDFAKQLLDLQTRTAEGENKLREKAAELADREKTLAETVSRLGTSENAIRDMTAQMASLTDEIGEKDRQLGKIQDMKNEHKRLFDEFEDLRKAYNEIVTDVMPTLQSERDELVLTVERQSEDEENLRSALKVSGRRMAVGYSLAAAAAIMMVVLPLTHWMGSDASNQSLAMSHQQSTDMQERLSKAEKRNVDAEKTIFNLERQSNLAKLELAKLEKANQELAAMTDQRTRELAVLKANLAGGSASARTVMAAGDNLAMSGPDTGRLRVNEVRDPGGSINNVLAENRERYAREDAMMASRQNKPSGGLQISAVSNTNSRNNSNAAKPQKNTKPAAAKTNEVAAATSTAKGATAVVKAGEGVAQVVYRVMGTRDPEVIAWVIKENNIKKDRRGNPRIYPEQKLTLPSVNSMVKSASAAKR